MLQKRNTLKKIIIKVGLLVALGVFLFPLNSNSQDDKKIVQLTGVVMDGDSTIGLPGVHIYVPRSGRGTISNIYGYFSFPLLVGDSVVFSSVGFERYSFIVPETDEDKITLMVPLVEDTTYLDEVEVLPYPTEELFKEAVLAMKMPNQVQLDNMADNLDPTLLAALYRNMPMDGSMNHKYFMQQQAMYMGDAYGPRPNQLLNPFAWLQFAKSLKKKK